MSGVGSIISGVGDLFAASSYGKAASLEGEVVNIEKESGALQQFQMNRQIYTGMGEQRAEIAGAGFKNSGSAQDILRNTVSIGSLRKGQIAINTALAVTGAQIQQEAYNAQETNALFGGIGDIAGGLTSNALSGSGMSGSG